MSFRALFLLVFVNFNLFAGDWNSVNHPGNMSAISIKKFGLLPKSGKVKKEPWTDTYWPTHKGGIAYRWLTGESRNYSVGYSSKGTAYLSPAEKFDLFMGRTEFPLTQYELRRTGINSRYDIPKWEGLCHGWAPAAYLYNEPKPVTVTGKNGDKIEFGSSDIKALLTYQMHLSGGKTKFLGSRCNLDANETNINSHEECNDTNAGAFHVVLANYVGISKKSFVIDKTRDAEVWNQPVYAYQTKVLAKSNNPSSEAAPKTAKEITVETKVWWVSEVNPAWKKVGTHLEVSTYKYVLELDFAGRIVGGRWVSWERPDFIWTQKKTKFSGLLKGLEKIYNKAK